MQMFFKTYLKLFPLKKFLCIIGRIFKCKLRSSACCISLQIYASKVFSQGELLDILIHLRYEKGDKVIQIGSCKVLHYSIFDLSFNPYKLQEPSVMAKLQDEVG